MVGAVSYLNTKPLIYGFEQGMMDDQIELMMDYPANIAQALLKDEIDIGLVPVAIIPEMKEYHIIGNHLSPSGVLIRMKSIGQNQQGSHVQL